MREFSPWGFGHPWRSSVLFSGSRGKSQDGTWPWIACEDCGEHSWLCRWPSGVKTQSPLVICFSGRWHWLGQSFPNNLGFRVQELWFQLNAKGLWHFTQHCWEGFWTCALGLEMMKHHQTIEMLNGILQMTFAIYGVDTESQLQHISTIQRVKCTHARNVTCKKVVWQR